MTVMNREVPETNEEDMTHFSLLGAAAPPALKPGAGRRKTKREGVVVGHTGAARQAESGEGLWLLSS